MNIYLLGDVELPIPVTHTLAVLVETLDILDVGLAVEKPLRSRWNRVEERLLSDLSWLSRHCGRPPALLSAPAHRGGWSWRPRACCLGRSRALFPIFSQPDPVTFLSLSLPLLPLLLLIQLLRSLSVGLQTVKRYNLKKNKYNRNQPVCQRQTSASICPLRSGIFHQTAGQGSRPS